MCGVIGVIGPYQEDNNCWAAYEAHQALLTLQHRGQDAAGILSYDDHSRRFYSRKDLGLISAVFSKASLEKLHGNMAIAHTRYATTGGNDRIDLQPMVTGLPFGLGMAHNGNLVNYYDLSRKLSEELHLQLLTNNDLEIFISLWCHYLQSKGIPHKTDLKFADAIEATKHIFEQVDGGYACVGLMAEQGLFAFRDPNGIRPLVLGQKQNAQGQTFYCIASETASLQFLGYTFLRDIRPGELIFIESNGKLHSADVLKKSAPAPCMFEWVYFSGAESSMDKRSIYGARLDLGRVLAENVRQAVKKNEIAPDIVCPVPDTSRPATISLAETLGIPYREAFIKNRYVQRSFILNSQEAREKAVQLKLSPIPSEIEGKNILLIDDSVVRGTTSKSIVSLLKTTGAKKITLAITCPAIRHPCFYGIDFPSPKELIATGKTEEEIAKWIGVDKVIYLTTDDLKEAIGKTSLCTGCIDGHYPTSLRGNQEFTHRRRGQPT